MEHSYLFLKQLDLAIFEYVNRELVSPTGDILARLLSSEVLLGAIILSVIFFSFIKRRWDIVYFFIVTLLVFGMVDAVSTFAIKPSVGRLRPCKEMQDTVRAIAGCRSLYGFPSNHAANSMVFATLVTLLWHRKTGFVLIVLSFFVGLSRLYLGVHYPSDIIFGFAFGGSTASCVALTLRHFTSWGSVNIHR